MPLKLVAPRQGKTPYWSVRGTHLGVYLDRSTKAAVRTTAAKCLVKWKEDIERGSLACKGEPTFLDAAVSYMAANGEDRFLEPITERLGRRLLRDIEQSDIDQLAISLYPKAAAATRNRQVYTPISAVLKHAGIVAKLRRPKGWRGTPRVRWLEPEQAFRAFAAADSVDAEFGLFLRFLCYTGLRLSEATGIKTDALNLAAAYCQVTNSKSGEIMGVRLPPVIVAALANHPRGLDRPAAKLFRFVKCGRIYTLLRQAEKACGLKLGFHLWRHTWATWMRRYANEDIAGLLATGRWKDPASARIYQHTVASEESLKADLLPVENQWKRGHG